MSDSERPRIYCYNLAEFKKAIKQRKTDLGYKKKVMYVIAIVSIAGFLIVLQCICIDVI